MNVCVVDWTAMAAWVQAIGSIAAIVAAIWIGKSATERAEMLLERERKRQAQIVIDDAMRFLVDAYDFIDARAAAMTEGVTSLPDGVVITNDLAGTMALPNIPAKDRIANHFLLLDRYTANELRSVFRNWGHMEESGIWATKALAVVAPEQQRSIIRTRAAELQGMRALLADASQTIARRHGLPDFCAESNLSAAPLKLDKPVDH